MRERQHSDSAIVVLTEGIGAEFGRAARRSFYTQYDRLIQNQRFRKRNAERQQALVDLLALAALFQTVIVPIQSTGSFVQVLQKAEATELRIGGDRLNLGWAKRARNVDEGFSILLQRLKLSPQLLQYATLDAFVKNAVDYFKLRDAR